MDRINDLLARLAELSDAELAELEGLILSEFDVVEQEEPTPQSVDTMVSLADALDALRAETIRREKQYEETLKQAQEASARVHGDSAVTELSSAAQEEPMTDDEKLAADAAAAAADAAQVADEAEAAVSTDPVDALIEQADADIVSAEESAEEEEDVTALSTSTTTSAPSAASELSSSPTVPAEFAHQEVADMNASNTPGGMIVPPASARPVVAAAQHPLGVGVSITASGEVPGYAIGQTVADMRQVSHMFAKRLHTLRNVQGNGEQYNVATLTYNYPETRRLTADESLNVSRIEAVTSPQAITAAAGICAPLEPVYDVSVCGDADRPIRDALARFNADRGGVRIYSAPTLSDSGVGIWSSASPAAKSCEEATCSAPHDILLDAVYSCLKFSNFTNRFFPEIVKANTDLAVIHHARVAEENLLKQIKDLSSVIDFGVAKKGITAPSPVGITRTMFVTIDNIAAYLRRKHRLRANAPMRVILPSWLGDAMAADLALQMPGDGLEVLSISQEKINGLFRERGINVTWSLDAWSQAGVHLAAPTAANGGWEEEIGFPMFPEGSFLFLDGGTLDLGVQRDMSMVTANEYATFVETFEGIALTGCEALWVNMPVCVSGAAAALVDTACK